VLPHATITKSNTDITKAPYLITVAPASSAAASDSTDLYGAATEVIHFARLGGRHAATEA
jgi:hypothetical protein